MAKLFGKALKVAQRAPLLVLGNFNAHHSAWGYPKCEKKGTKIWETAQELGFTLLNDADRPTRVGNSVSRNTSSNLEFAKNTDQPKWENLELNVGSDHYIISTEVSCRGCKRRKWKVRHTRWDTFRDVRTKREHTPIEDLDEWVHTLVKDAESNTAELVQEEDGPKPDSRLIHLWEARSSLQKRWLN